MDGRREGYSYRQGDERIAWLKPEGSGWHRSGNQDDARNGNACLPAFGQTHRRFLLVCLGFYTDESLTAHCSSVCTACSQSRLGLFRTQEALYDFC